VTVSLTTGINGGVVTTTGIQTYTGAATLGANTALTGTVVTFGGTLDNGWTLGITGAAIFNGAVGGVTPLTSVTVSLTTGINGGVVTTTGIQTYTGAATLGANAALTGTVVTFGGTLNNAWTLGITGGAIFGGAVGGVTP
jgi:hypothetical protein